VNQCVNCIVTSVRSGWTVGTGIVGIIVIIHFNHGIHRLKTDEPSREFDFNPSLSETPIHALLRNTYRPNALL